MPRDWRLRVADILDSIAQIEDYLTDMTLERFVSDRKTTDAVLHNLYVVGEAVSRLPEEITSSHPKIPWAEIRKFRNFLAHGYFNVNVETIWKTVLEDIPPLKAVLLEIQAIEGGDT